MKRVSGIGAVESKTKRGSIALNPIGWRWMDPAPFQWLKLADCANRHLFPIYPADNGNNTTVAVKESSQWTTALLACCCSPGPNLFQAHATMTATFAAAHQIATAGQMDPNRAYLEVENKQSRFGGEQWRSNWRNTVKMGKRSCNRWDRSIMYRKLGGKKGFKRKGRRQIT